MITTITSDSEYSLPLHLYINKHLIVQAGNPPLTPNLTLSTFSQFYSHNFPTLSANDIIRFDTCFYTVRRYTVLYFTKQ